MSRTPVVDVIKVIRVIANRGLGTEADPVREVTFLYGMNGELIGELDAQQRPEWAFRAVDQYGHPMDEPCSCGPAVLP